jgi:hypothetical protein
MKINEFIVEATGNNYLYYATSLAMISGILDTGIIKADQGTSKNPIIKTYNSKRYVESGKISNSNNQGNAVIILLDRRAIANQYRVVNTDNRYEEVILVPKGALPIRGKIQGFYFNKPNKDAIADKSNYPWFQSVLNSPYLLN